MSEKEVKVDQSLLDDGSYLEEEPKNNKVLFIVLGVVIATLTAGGAIMMFSGSGEDVSPVEQPTTPSLTLTTVEQEESPQISIELETVTEPEPEPTESYGMPIVDEEFDAQLLLEADIQRLVAQMDRESETQAEKRVELMEQAGYEIDEETQVITAPNGDTIEADGTVTTIEGVVTSDNSMEANTDGSYSIVYEGVSYEVTQEQMDRAWNGRGYSTTDGIPASVFSQIKNAGVTSGVSGLTYEEGIAQRNDMSLVADEVLVLKNQNTN